MKKKAVTEAGKTGKPKYSKAILRENRQLYLLMLPVFILIAIFSYGPMFGIIIAFQDYWPGDPFFGKGVHWVGLKNFTKFIQGEYFARLIKNTLVLSGLNLIFGFTMPIIFALYRVILNIPAYVSSVRVYFDNIVNADAVMPEQ